MNDYLKFNNDWWLIFDNNEDLPFIEVGCPADDEEKLKAAITSCEIKYKKFKKFDSHSNGIDINGLDKKYIAANYGFDQFDGHSSDANNIWYHIYIFDSTEYNEYIEEYQVFRFNFRLYLNDKGVALTQHITRVSSKGVTSKTPKGAYKPRK